MKKFSEFVKESVDNEMTPQDIDELKKYADYLRDRYKTRYIEALDGLFAGYQAKQIYNADFGDWNSTLSSSLDNVRSEIREPYLNKFRENNFSEDSDGYGFYVNSIKKELRHWEQYKTKYPEIYDFWYSVRKLPDFMKTLKTYVVKGRKPKPIDPNKWYKPMVPDEARAKAESFLKEASEDVKNEYYDSFEKYFLEHVDQITKIMKDEDAYTYRKLTPIIQRYRNLMNIFQLAFKSETDRIDAKYILKSNYKAIIRKAAERTVDSILHDFIKKNGEKLGHIFAKKANITEHKILQNRVHNNVMENTMKFTFDDKSSFVIYTSTVYKTSTRGVFFAQFPTRFTDVKLADGTKMGMPSEEKMIKEF